MSLYAALDTDTDGGTQVATNTGWGEFIDWTQDLDAEKFGEVIHLADYGWSQSIDELKTQLESAVNEHDVSSDDLRDVIDGLLQIIDEAKDAGAIVVTDGFGPSEITHESTESV